MKKSIKGLKNQLDSKKGLNQLSDVQLSKINGGNGDRPDEKRVGICCAD